MYSSTENDKYKDALKVSAGLLSEPMSSKDAVMRVTCTPYSSINPSAVIRWSDKLLW